jgi:hypothetical protein
MASKSDHYTIPFFANFNNLQTILTRIVSQFDFLVKIKILPLQLDWLARFLITKPNWLQFGLFCLLLNFLAGNIQ